MYFVIQSLIVFAVMSSNIYFHWTPNGYLAGLIAGGAALVATLALNDLLALARRKKRGDRAR